MSKEAIQKSFKKNDLETSKLILCKLIKHYSYDSIVDYLLNPNKINNPKLELIMKRLINKIGVDTLAFLLCNENLNSYKNNKEKEEEKTVVKSNYENEKETKFKASIKKIRKKYRNKINAKHRIMNKDKTNNDIYKYKKYKFKNKTRNYINEDYTSNNDFNDNNSSSKRNSNSSNEMSEESDSNDNNSSSNNNNCNSFINSNISNNGNNNFSDLNDFSEFCDSNIHNEDIINLVNEMEEEEEEESENKNEKEKEEEIILDATNSYVYKIIYKEPKTGELYYYCYESINEDQTLNLKCIDELCKSKGIYNSTNKQIIITVKHTIIYEEHCYLKPNFGGEELNLEIFDFIKDSPEITGIEILKSKEKYSKKSNENNKNKNKDKNKYSFMNDKNINKNIKFSFRNQNEDNLDNLMEEENINMSEVENIINEEEPIFQNRIANNITQIIKNDSYDKEKKNDEDKNNKEKDIKENIIKENFTLININYLNINNNLNSYNQKKSKSKKINKNNNTNKIDSNQKNEIRLIDINEQIKTEEDEKINKEKNKNIKKEDIKDENKESKNIKKEEIKEENKEKNIIIKKEDLKDENKENILNSSQKNNNKDNLDTSYNYIEFNIDKIKRLEGTENSYSKKVYEINVQNKKKVEEEKRLSKSRKDVRKSEERFKGNYPLSRSRSRSRSPSYLILNENGNEKESENLLDNDSESEVSKLSVISHFKNKKIEEKIIIDENDSLFSFDLLNGKDREKFNKRLNDETIFLSDDSDKRKRLEHIQKKFREKHLKKFFKKSKFKKLFFKVNERIIRDEEIVNKRRIFGIFRKSFSPNNSINEEKEEENENKNKNDIVENVENNNDKKRLPIFGIYNPNKHNPKFFVDNNLSRK